MIQQTYMLPFYTPYNGAAYVNDESSRLRKRKLSFPASFNYEETQMIANKKRKKSSVDLDLPEISLPQSGNDDVFDWMENILNSPADKSNTSSSLNIDINSVESDPCYEEMISLLAEDDNDNEENVFKNIYESFISDRLLEHDSFASTTMSPTLKRSPSFNTRRARSSRIGIREGLDKLVKANRLTAKTRHMLLNCKLSLYKNNSQ